MYELIQAAPRAYYIQCPAKMGLWVPDGQHAVLIDSGGDKDAGRKVQKILGVVLELCREPIEFEELLDEKTPSFDPRLDPKCCWALRHPEFFPVEVNRADYEALLRVPGLGVVSARRILTARRSGPLRVENLPKLGVVMKRAQYFLTANGQMADGLRFTQDSLLRNLIAAEQSQLPQPELQQLSLFDSAGSLREATHE